MTLVKCFNCGRVNSNENTACEGCGEKLLGRQEYEEKLQELRDYGELRKRYSISEIVLAILVLILLFPSVKWLIVTMLPMLGTEFLPPAVILNYTVPAIILLVFLLAVLPRIWGRWKILSRYRWTRERMQDLEREVKSLPKDFFKTVIQKGDEAKIPVQKNQAPPIILLVIVFTLIALVYLEKYTNLKPMDYITSLAGIENTQTEKKNAQNTLQGQNQKQNTQTKIENTQNTPKVLGKYDHHYEAADLGGGVKRSEQTFSYVFFANGTYTTYLEGHQQYSGTWSQSGNILTIYIPAVPGISDKYIFKGTVSSDGNSFDSRDGKYIRVKQ